MKRGGKREGAGRKPRLSARYRDANRRVRVGLRALVIGQRCEVLYRKAYTITPGKKVSRLDYALNGATRPWGKKRRIAKQVAKEFGETPRMVWELWREYRNLERDLEADLAENEVTV